LKNKLQEIWEELKSVLSGKTIDAIIPPLVYVILNALFGLEIGVIGAVVVAIALGIRRLIQKQNWSYALGGVVLVGVAAGLALITRNAATYFIPAIISSGVLVLAVLVSLVIGKPLAAWASHLTRGWPLEWFWREDVKPAYLEVTWMWAVFFAMRLALQIVLYLQGEAATLAWANTLLGWPVTIIVLVISYLYGIWRLRRLGGPGVDEFQEGKEPPWEGQTRGF